MYRFTSSEYTLSKLKKYIEKAKITRLANLSYLDNSTTVQVYSAIRPNAKSLTTSMGKADNQKDAQCSALMESIETFFAEHVQIDLKSKSQQQLIEHKLPFVNVNSLNDLVKISNEYKLNWCLGHTLISNQKIYIPHVALTLDSNLLISKIYRQNSDGIASGINYFEALIYSFLEVIERYSMKFCPKYQLQYINDKFSSLITNKTICISFYTYINAFYLPVIACILKNTNPLDNQVLIGGYSCHFSKHEALKKSFWEAIQTKIGIISGLRDDLDDSCYNFKQTTIFPELPDVISFSKLNSFEIPLEQQYNEIIELLKKNKKDLAIYTYLDEDITILRTFLINDE